MKTRHVSCMWFALLASSACELETEEAAPEQAGVSPMDEDLLSTSVFRADVGAPIDAATANRWMENHRLATGDDTVSYIISSAVLREVLSAPGSVGISMQYGTDDAGRLHIFTSPVDSAGRSLTATPEDAKRFIARYRGAVKAHFFGRNTFTRLLDEGRCGAVRATLALWSLPASSAPYCMLMPIFPSAVDSAGRLLTDVAAPADARRFIDQYSGTVKSHFFGSDTYTRLLDEGRCEAVRATLALDDALAPQLLLSDAAEKEPRVYEDESAVCPTICPQHEES